ncbi:MAG: proton-conducting membrane transporter [Clostridia bacterium]|nr:proton-conducting membrane transporter [Clostridia bacterium]
MLMLAAVLLPIAAGLVLPLLRCENGRQRAVWTETAVIGASFLAVMAVLLQKSAVQTDSIIPGLTICFRVDEKGSLFALLVASLWPLSTLYGFAYMEHEERPDRFFSWYLVSNGVTFAVCFAGNLLTLYMAYECLTLATLPMVNHKDDGPSRRAGMKYAAWTIGGAALGFVALILTIRYGGDSLAFTAGGNLDPAKVSNHEDLLRWIYIIAFLGFGVKAAVAPFSAWLPEASVAPTPVTALLHAVAVVNTGAFAVIRVTEDVFGTELLYGTFAQTVTLGIACFTILLGTIMAVREQHLKRRLAWSTVSNLSYMLMGATLMTAGGFNGAMTHMVFHGLMKIVLFFCAGAILVQTEKEYVQETRGLAKVMPLTCGAFTLAAVALVGIPPLCGFVSKWRLLTSAMATGLPMGIAATVTLIVAAVLTAIYVLSPVMAMYFRPLNEEDKSLEGQNRDPDWRMLFPILLICVFIIVFGMWNDWLTVS